MSQILNRPANILMQILNYDMARFDETFLYVILNNRIEELNIKSESDYYQLLIHNSIEKIIFTNLLNISYSIFYRNQFTFSVLEHLIFPKIVFQKQKKKEKNIRIWSCACASGEEPYTLAMIVENLIHYKKDSINYQIFATDIDQKQIDNAKTGIYADHVLKNVPLKNIQKWFTFHENKYSINHSLKQKIIFSELDLLDPFQMAPPDSIFGGFDIIMCANLLFYFNDESRNIIFKKIKNLSNKDCFFITGEVERDYFLKLNFIEVFPHSSIFQLPKYFKL